MTRALWVSLCAGVCHVDCAATAPLCKGHTLRWLHRVVVPRESLLGNRKEKAADVMGESEEFGLTVLPLM